MLAPLNGSKTRPLTEVALLTLRDLATTPRPRQAINPGLANRLLRESLVEAVGLPSPYMSHKGRNIEHLRASEIGIAKLVATPGFSEKARK